MNNLSSEHDLSPGSVSSVLKYLELTTLIIKSLLLKVGIQVCRSIDHESHEDVVHSSSLQSKYHNLDRFARLLYITSAIISWNVFD